VRRWRISRIRVSYLTVAWVTVLWVLLWGELSVANVLAGIVIGVVVPALLPLPRVGPQHRVRPLAVLRLLGHFAVDLVVASFQVAYLALAFRHRPHGAVVGVHLRTDDDLYLVLTSVITTLVPGSVVVEALRRNGLMYVHVLDLEAMGGVEGVRTQVLKVEERVLRALAPDEELAATGLGKRA
jgi:multicomponent Na+:H+ antiporter subunit E